MCDEGQPDCLTSDVTEDEIRAVIRNLPKGKSSCVGGIMYELYANSIDILIKPICQLFNVIFNTIPLFEKGSREDVKHYRGISLLCCFGKIFRNCLNNRLVVWAYRHGKLDEGQSTYRIGRSAVGHMFTLYSVAQKYISKRGGRFYCLFVDFTRAFDSIPHGHLWYRLINNGIHGIMIHVLCMHNISPV